MARFVFHDDFPPAEGGWYAHFDHRPPPSAAWRECDARGVIERHQRSWLDDFDRWHAKLCREGEAGSSWWWLSRVSRPNLWAQASSLKPLFMAAAIREWMLTHPDVDVVHVIAAPPEATVYLDEFQRAPVDCQAGWTSWRALVSGLWAFAAQLRYLPRHVFRRAPIKPVPILFYSHLFFPTHGAGDHFFGAIIDGINTAPEPIQVAYYVDGVAKLDVVRAQLAERPVHAWILLDCLRFVDVVRIAVAAAGLWLALRGLQTRVPPIRLGSYQSFAFTPRYLAEELWAQPPIMEIAIYHALRRALERSESRLVVYPYEEKGLERGLLRACRESRVTVTTIGYAHPAHTTAHLALRSRGPAESAPPSPDLIMTAGPLERSFLVDWGRKPADRVAVLGSHRYRAPLPSTRHAATRRNCLRVVMITGHGFELSMLANLVARRPDIFATDEVLVRRTRGGWFAAQDAGIRRLTNLSDRVTVGSGSLVEQLEWCDVALFSSTTAGVEAMLAGRLAVYLSLHDVFEADPLLGEPGVFASCKNDNELARALARARKIDDAEHDRIVGRQAELANRILAPVDTDALLSAIDYTMRRQADGACAGAASSVTPNV